MKISPVVLEIFWFRQWIFAIPLLYPLGKERHHSLEQIGMSYTQGYFEASLNKIGPLVLEKIFKFSSKHFGYFDAIFFLFRFLLHRVSSYLYIYVIRCYCEMFIESKNHSLQGKMMNQVCVSKVFFGFFVFYICLAHDNFICILIPYL